MKILYLSEDYPYSKVHHELCNNIVSISGEHLILYSVLRSKIQKRDLRATYQNVKYATLFNDISSDISRHELRYKYDFSYKIKIKYNWLVSHCKISEVGVVHAATLFSEGAVALRLYEEYGIPYIVAVRGSDINFYFKYMVHLWHWGIKILSNAQRVIFLTDSGAQQLLRRNRILFRISSALELKKCIIPNGIDNFWLEHRYPKKVLQVPSNILYVGIFKHNKNVCLLCESVLKLKKKHPHIKLTLVGGGGEEHEKVLHYCNKYPDTFSYLGKIYDKKILCNIFRENDIFAMASHSETFGLVYVEALSQGLPVLYTKGQGIDGVFEENIGEAVVSTSQKSLLSGLNKLINTYATYQLDETDLDRFSWNNIAHSYLNIYFSIFR